MDSVIGALRVILGADTAEFETGMKRVSSQLAGHAKSFVKVGAAIATAAAGMAAALLKNSLASADAMLEASQRAGVAFEAFQELNHAASVSGVSTEQLEGALAMLSRRMGQTAADSAAALGKIGISVRDSNGQIRDSISVLEEVANRYQAAGSEAQKARILTEAFGRSGMQLAPMLKDGAAGLRAMREEAQRLGLVLDEATAQKADALNDQLTTLGQVIRMNLQHGVLQGFLGSMKDLRSVFSDPAFVNGIRQAGVALGQFMAFAIRHGDKVVATAAGITAMFLATRVGARGVTTAIAGLAAGLGSYIALSQSGTASTADLAAELTNVRNQLGQYSGIQEKQTNEVRESIAELTRSAEHYRKLTDALYLGEDAHRRMKDAIDIVNESIKLGLKDGTALGEQWKQTAVAAKQAEYEYERVGERLQQLKQFGEQVGSTISSAFEDAIFRGEKFSDVLKGLAQDLLRLAFRQTVGQGLSSIFGSLFSGMPMKLPGFADGGSFTVGGAGGLDSQLAMMRVTPGETVSVSKPGEGGPVGLTVVQNNDFSSGITPTDRAWLESRINAAMNQVRSEVVTDIRRGNSLDRNFLMG